jgi:hypothetical protein
MNLLLDIERYLRRSKVSASRFGRLVSGDPRLVFDLRRGREPRPAMAARVVAHIAGGHDASTPSNPSENKGELA